MAVSLSDAKRLIPPSVARLILESVLSALSDYNESDPELRARHSATTRANMINDYMLHHARAKMWNHPDVKLIQRRKRTHLLIADQFEVKFKKLNRNRRWGNIPTKVSVAYENQIPLYFPLQLELKDVLTPRTNLVAGYQLNSLRTGAEAVFIVCPLGTRNRWEWRIPFTAVSAEVKQTGPVTDSPSPKVVKPKNRPVRKQSKEEANG